MREAWRAPQSEVEIHTQLSVEQERILELLNEIRRCRM